MCTEELSLLVYPDYAVKSCFSVSAFLVTPGNTFVFPNVQVPCGFKGKEGAGLAFFHVSRVNIKVKKKATAFLHDI